MSVESPNKILKKEILETLPRILENSGNVDKTKSVAGLLIFNKCVAVTMLLCCFVCVFAVSNYNRNFLGNFISMNTFTIASELHPKIWIAKFLQFKFLLC